MVTAPILSDQQAYSLEVISLVVLIYSSEVPQTAENIVEIGFDRKSHLFGGKSQKNLPSNLHYSRLIPELQIGLVF